MLGFHGAQKQTLIGTRRQQGVGGTPTATGEARSRGAMDGDGHRRVPWPTPHRSPGAPSVVASSSRRGTDRHRMTRWGEEVGKAAVAAAPARTRRRRRPVRVEGERERRGERLREEGERIFLKVDAIYITSICRGGW